MVKIGDVIKVCENSRSVFYKPGAVGRVVEIDADGDAWVNFSEMGNPKGSFLTICDGTWCIAVEKCEVVG